VQLRYSSAVRPCALGLAFVISGCAGMQDISRLRDGPGLEPVSAEIKEYTKNQAEVLAELRTLAGIAADEPVDNWNAIIEAGMGYADARCEAYMQALFRLNRNRRTAVSEIGLVGGATAGIMAAAQSAARDVAIVAILFGLAASTVDTLSSNLLFDLDPSSVRTLVMQMQRNYRNALPQDYDSWPAAAAVIRSYAALCVPANIEAEVNLSVKKAVPGAVRGDGATGRPPTVTNAIAAPAPEPSGIFGADQSSGILRLFVFPNGGTVNEANRRRLESYLEARQIKVSVVTFINDQAYAAERLRAISFLSLQ